MDLATMNSTPYGFTPEPRDVLVRASGNNASIAVGDLVYFDFLSGTNDPNRLADAGVSVPAVNGYQTVVKYDADVHYSSPGIYGVALDVITTNSSGVPTAYGRVRVRGRVYVLADSTGTTKGLGIRPSAGTDGAISLKAVADSSSATTLKASAGVTLGIAETTFSSGYGYCLFDGVALHGAKLA